MGQLVLSMLAGKGWGDGGLQYDMDCCYFSAAVVGAVLGWSTEYSLREMY